MPSRRLRIRVLLVVLGSLVAFAVGWSWGAQAQLFPGSSNPNSPNPSQPAQISPVLPGGGSLSLDTFCRQPLGEQERKEQLRLQSLGSDAGWATYTQVVSEHRAQLEQCRRSRWPQIQAVWLRLYPCDVNPGVLEHVFDQIVNLGYNRVFIETFYDGQALLPGSEGSPWPAVEPNHDLLQMALTLAQRRGLSAYAWVFTMNMGYSYSQIPDRQMALARNGTGRTTVLDPTTATLADLDDAIGPDQVFVDPYNALAQQDYQRLLSGILRRRPDGVLFDYIRYPRGTGASSVAANVRDLWIHADASRRAFIGLGENAHTQGLLERYLNQGYVTVNDVREMDSRLGAAPPLWRQPGDPLPPASPNLPIESPLDVVDPTVPDVITEERGFLFSPDFLSPDAIQGELRRSSPELGIELGAEEDQTPASPENPEEVATPSPTPPVGDPGSRHARIQSQLWPLAVEFAQQGVLNYLDQAVQPVHQQGIPAGAVFFSDANARVGTEGYDSRLQPWERFDTALEWHPMAYALCEDASCIADQVGKVLEKAGPQTLVCPAIAGLWGQALTNRPMLEVQMQTLQQRHPQLQCVSHFAYSWVATESDRDRKACRL